MVKKRRYKLLAGNIGEILTRARRGAARAVNAVLTATYWEIGRQIVEFLQDGETRAGYGKELMRRLSDDLTERFGRGFSVDNLELMRHFYTCYRLQEITETVSRKLVLEELAELFPLSWSHYCLLIKRCGHGEERSFYEAEALRGGWSVRQLDRQISTCFYQRTLLSRNKAKMLSRAAQDLGHRQKGPMEEIKDPFVLEFLDLKDEYSESDLEESLIKHLESFILELGEDFCFMGRQKGLRIGGEWYRVDLLFYHRRLCCLVLIDLKLGKFTHADAGQMHMYLNYARENWSYDGENPPVGLILCAGKDRAVAHYALEGLKNTVLASEYRLKLPAEERLIEELKRSRATLETRQALRKARSLPRKGEEHGI